MNVNECVSQGKKVGSKPKFIYCESNINNNNKNCVFFVFCLGAAYTASS